MPPKPVADDAAADTAVDASVGEKKKKRSKKPPTEKGYGIYLHKVHKQLHGEKRYTMSSKAMEVVNALVEDLERRLTDRAFSLAKFQKKSTLSAPHVQTAVKIVFPPDMGGMAISEGTKALTKYTAAA